MRLPRRLLYLLCFAGLAIVAALAVARVGAPSIAGLLTWVALAGTVAGAPGLVHRRAWPAALVLLPAGACLILAAQIHVPAGAHGLGEHYNFYLDHLRVAARAYSTDTFPFHFAHDPGLTVLLSLVVYAAAGLASFIALSLRRALPAVVIFLALLGFSLTVDGVTRVIWLPFAYLVLAGCVLALSRSLERQRGKARDGMAGAGTAVIGVLLALLLLGATPVSASRPWRDWRTWSLSSNAAARPDFDWMRNFPELLNPRANVRVMVVETPVASYWRANALALFDGSAWYAMDELRTELTTGGATGADTRVQVDSPFPRGTTVTEVFKARSLFTAFFFTGGTPKSFVFDRPMSVSVTRAYALRPSQPLGPEFAYKLTAVVPRLKPADLVGRGRDYSQDTLDYTELPFPAAPSSLAAWRSAMSGIPDGSQWLGLYQLNQDIVRGATDPYQITLRVEQYLRTHYSYSLAPPASRFRSPYAAFLFDTKIGYCQHFAGAMAMLLRFNGIPARVAVGFATGTRVAKNAFAVGTNDAHAWVEVYFPRVGWLPFDPTPGSSIPGAGASSSSSGFVNPFPHDASSGSAAAAAPATPNGRVAPNPLGRGANGATGSAAAPAESLGWLPWVVGFAVALLAWPVGRARFRQRGLHGGSRERRLRVSLALIQADLRDHGVVVPRSQTLVETARFLKAHLDLDAASLAERAEAVLFGGRSAEEGDLAELARLRHELNRRLRARSGWARAVLARYGVRVAAR